MKKVFACFAAVVLLVLGTMLYMIINIDVKRVEPDVTDVNDIQMTAKENWNDTNFIIKKAEKYNFGCTILDYNENVVAKTDGMPLHLSKAVRNRDIVTCVCEGNKLLGYIILSDGANKIIDNYKTIIITSCFTALVLIIAASVIFLLFLYFRIARPFEKLRKFAAYVAQGNFDIPLDMDKGNMFGAFTESFDIMREELALAKKHEYEAEKSKKELIASLSHDIKTPVASIKAAVELLSVTTKDLKSKEKLIGIEHKTDQIELLIDNLFHSTLEELEELKVAPEEQSSDKISKMIILSDYSGLVKDFSIEECIILYDELRLGQVIDNIISNSYKYANTEINVNSEIIEGCLKISIKDKASRLSEEDIRRSCEKFYRGKNSSQKTGSGLGLYVSSYFMKKMGGALEVEYDGGFCVNIYLTLA